MKQILKNLLINLKEKKGGSNVALTSVIGLNSVFEGYNRIYDHTLFSGKLGLGSYISKHSHISAHIGRFTCIGSNVRVVQGNHPIQTWATIHPAFFSNKKRSGISFVDSQLYNETTYVGDEVKAACIIGNDVWIGDNVTILSGVTIGDGAIVGACALVTKDIPPYAIAIGLPARVIRYRFSKEQIEALQKIQWWNKDISWFKKHADLFQNVDKLIEECK